MSLRRRNVGLNPTKIAVTWVGGMSRWSGVVYSREILITINWLEESNDEVDENSWTGRASRVESQVESS